MKNPVCLNCGKDWKIEKINKRFFRKVIVPWILAFCVECKHLSYIVDKKA